MAGGGYLIRAQEIAALAGEPRDHAVNPNVSIVRKSLGELTGLTGLGVHIFEVPPGKDSTAFHNHINEDEFVYILDGQGTARIGDETFHVTPGDFMGFRKSGLPHMMSNTGTGTLKMLVVGQRLGSDIVDYPEDGTRIFRAEGTDWHFVDTANLKMRKR